MKKTFLVRRNALLSSRGISWGVLASAFALLALFIRLLAPNLFLEAFTPIFRVSDAVANEGHMLLSSFGDAAALAAQNEKLASENAALAIENQTLLQKDATLSALLGAPAAQKNLGGVLAGVVVRPPESPYDTLLLSAGQKQGVVLGMEAFAENGVPVGIVSSVLDTFSRVTLFSSPGVMTSGWVGHSAVPLAITGMGAGAMNATVARAANIAEGDTVFVPGPGMLPIGKVVHIEGNPLSAGVTLRILPAANLFSLSWVELRSAGAVPVTLATSTQPL